MHSLNTIGQLAKDSIFPAFCFGCGREEVYLCDECFGAIDLFGAWRCPLCHTPQIGGHCCVSCAKKSPLYRHIALTHFEQTKLFGALIHAWKYEYVEELLRVFVRCFATFVLEYPQVFNGVEAIVPVPLHPRRFAERGFNQAEVLADLIGSRLHMPVFSFLERVRYTSQQALLSKEERKINVKDAFVLQGTVSPHVRRVLLVDDVYTTGSTMQECAKVFRNRGILAVGFSLARG